MGAIREFMDRNHRHFNARETVATSRRGEMLVSLAGAMSTGELGISLSRMIREDKVHAVSCTGANLEEDVFNLLGHDDYELIPDWRALPAADEVDLRSRGMNRVTDTCIPEDVMRHLEGCLIEAWGSACRETVRKFPAEYLFEILRSGALDPHYQSDPQNSWLIAAMER